MAKTLKAIKYSFDFESNLTDIITKRINQKCQYEGLDAVKLRYGISQSVKSITKSIFLIALALILGLFTETLVIIISFNLIRRNAQGLHSTKSSYCILSSSIIFIGGAFLLKDIEITNYLVSVIFICVITGLALFAPADTEKRPIVGKERRKRLRRRAIISALVIYLVACLVPFDNYKTLITFGAIIETIVILPVTYKFIGRKYNNYEKYENTYGEN